MGRIVLFTPFTPLTGGGGTNLRTLLQGMRGMDIEWVYSAPADSQYPGSTWLGPSPCGGSPWIDLPQLAALWLGFHVRRFRDTLEALISRKASVYWVVGHHEGILYARELIKSGFRVHLTIQDDLPDGVMGRSLRYRALAPFVRRPFYEILRHADSVDVTSDGMRAYYEEKVDLKSAVVHPVVWNALAAPTAPHDDGEVVVGHVGNLYSVNEWWQFLEALVTFAKRRGLKARMLMIGLSPKYRSTPAVYRDLVDIREEVPEDRAIDLLANCQILYAMYPFNARARVFRRTSLPTKLSTYLQCGRPILAHTPQDSTLADVVRRYQLGPICDTVSPWEIAAHISDCMKATAGRFRSALIETYGPDNAETMAGLLSTLASPGAAEN
jgi:hypothetical protein